LTAVAVTVVVAVIVAVAVIGKVRCNRPVFRS
jgi:hypothetical protein